MKLWITILLLYQFTTFSQDADRLSFDFFDPNIKLYVIGESHFEDDGDLQVALFDYITKNGKVNAFLTELSVEVGALFNDYVLTGKRESDVNKIYSLLDPKVSTKIQMILEFLKDYNLSHEQKINVVGLDRYHFFKLKRQIKGLNTIFPETEKINLPLVRKYVVQEEVRNLNRKKSAALIKSLIQEVEQHQQEYSLQMGDRLLSYTNYLKDLEFHYVNNNIYNYKKVDSIRETFLTNNLLKAMDAHQVCFMICGADHAIIKRDDNFSKGYPFTSMTAIANEKYPSQVFSIIMHYNDKKSKKFDFYYNLLNKPISEFVKDNSVKYVAIDQNQIQNHPDAKVRSSMIIIMNKLYKPKSKQSDR